MTTIAKYTSPRANQVVIDIEFPESLLEFEKRVKQKMPGMMRRIALEGKTFWKTLAGQKLKSSRNAYKKGIDFEIVDDLSFYLTLEGFLPYSVEYGRKAFDMKPGFLKNSQYRVIPLNINRYINMTKPTMYRTVSVNSPADSWQHPGFRQPVRLSDEVVKELDTNIIPKHLNKMLTEVGTP